jgi:DNA ligase-1
MKPMLASDVDFDKLKFPVGVQPKIDGVRALNMLGRFTGRSLKQFKNLHLTQQFSVSACLGFDGELAAERETHPDLCRITSSATGTIKGEPYVIWWLFDYVTVLSAHLPYRERLELLKQEVDVIWRHQFQAIGKHLQVVPTILCYNMDELNAADAYFLAQGYEGTITRDMDAPHKQGRSTPTEGGLGRIKRFIDFEFHIDELIEGEENQNEAQINELGQTFRSSHQENKVANGMVGAMLGTVLADVLYEGKVLFAKGQQVRVGAGCMSHDERRAYFANPSTIIGHIGKAKFFPKGIKDKPRFPTFQSIRSPEDMS